MLKISNIFKAIILFAILSLTLFGESISPDISKIINRGVLRVAIINKDQVPFFFQENRELKGIDVEMGRSIARALNVDIHFIRTAKSFNDLIPLVNRGVADIVISKLSKTLKRSRTALFSMPYLTFHQALAFNRIELAKRIDDERKTTTFVKNFRGTIGMIAKSSYVNYAKLYFPDAEIVEFETWEKVVSAVIQGKILAAYRDEFEIKKVLTANPEVNLLLKIVLLKDTKDDIAIAMNWDAANLKDYIDIYLLNSPTKLNADLILDKYRGVIKKLNKHTFEIKKTK